ncbi:MAG TPA: hypothetical protein VMH23_15085, partial [Bacteroidota bacterium]|nr:hypothetical protein [Bacteroidota bacterium]
GEEQTSQFDVACSTFIIHVTIGRQLQNIEQMNVGRGSENSGEEQTCHLDVACSTFVIHATIGRQPRNIEQMNVGRGSEIGGKSRPVTSTLLVRHS